MDREDELQVYELALGATRPALVPYIGIPFVDGMVFFVAAMELITVGLILVLICFQLPAFLLSLALYKRDYNAGRRFVCWLSTTARPQIFAALGYGFSLRAEYRARAMEAFTAPGITPRPHASFRGIPR